jgi:hypothetical protein
MAYGRSALAGMQAQASREACEWRAELGAGQAPMSSCS